MLDSNNGAPFLISEKRAAQLIGVSSAMLIAGRFKKAPLLPFVRVGKRSIRYRLVDIHEFIERNTVGAPRDPARSGRPASGLPLVSRNRSTQSC